MSTRSRIGILKKDKSVESVYCHFDGYPEYNGVILSEYYSSTNAVNMLMALGEISSLKEKLQDSVCYNVWRNEDTHSIKMSSLEDLEVWAEKSDQEYIYLWDEELEKWIFSSIPWNWEDEEPKNKYKWEDLKDYLTAEKILEKWGEE